MVAIIHNTTDTLTLALKGKQSLDSIDLPSVEQRSWHLTYLALLELQINSPVTTTCKQFGETSGTKLKT